MTTALEPRLEIEKRALGMFRQHELAKDFKKLIVILVYTKIKAEPDISETKLKTYMRLEHNIPSPIVEGALSSLVSSLGFAAVKAWYYPNKKTILRYVVKEPNEIEPWIESVVSTKPEWQEHLNATIR